MRISYPIPWSLLIRIVIAVLTGKTLSFHEEAVICINKLSPALDIQGAENLPLQEGYVVLVNHYYRPWFQAWWIAFAIASVIPREMHWIMTASWTYPGRPYGKLLETISRWVFRHVARVFAFTTMPPMPPRSHEVLERAQAVRKILKMIHKHPSTVLGLAPEGGDNLDGKFHLPPAGAGRFIHHLQESGLTLIPAAIFETDGLHLCFGVPICLDSQNIKLPAESDREYCRQVFEAIATLLPEENISSPPAHIPLTTF